METMTKLEMMHRNVVNEVTVTQKKQREAGIMNQLISSGGELMRNEMEDR